MLPLLFVLTTTEGHRAFRIPHAAMAAMEAFMAAHPGHEVPEIVALPED